jgi:hypothetical protein
MGTFADRYDHPFPGKLMVDVMTYHHPSKWLVRWCSTSDAILTVGFCVEEPDWPRTCPTTTIQLVIGLNPQNISSSEPHHLVFSDNMNYFLIKISKAWRNNITS